MARDCESCEEPIPEERLKALPNTTECVSCVESSGDVFRYKGIREPVTESFKHLGGCENNIIRSPIVFEKAKRVLSDLRKED